MITTTPAWAQNNTLTLPVPRFLDEWITTDASLTQTIRARFPNVKMQLLSTTAAHILKHESDFYQQSIYSNYRIRNILFYQKDTPLVLGRSVIPCCNNSITATRSLLKLGAERLLCRSVSRLWFLLPGALGLLGTVDSLTGLC